MKLRKIKAIETPYENISESDYQIEKRRLQVELLKIQQWVMKRNLKLIVLFEGRDAAGKGSTIKRFTENLIPSHFSIHALEYRQNQNQNIGFEDMNLYFPKKVIFHFLIDLGIHEPLLNPLWDIVRVNTNDLLKSFALGAQLYR